MSPPSPPPPPLPADRAPGLRPGSAPGSRPGLGVPWRTALIVLCAVGAPRTAASQVGVTTDIITGMVTGPDGQPLAGAVVEAVSVETQLSRQRTTDPRGRFTILFPDGGGRYELVVRFIGMAPARLTVARQADEDRIVANVRMDLLAVALEPVTVQGRSEPQGIDRLGPGATGSDLRAEVMTRLPVEASDLNTLATLAPGVVGLRETDSTPAAFSVAGQRLTANRVTLDGMSFSDGSVPQDAIRATRVVTNTYDVARGQFSGGLVASTTRSGTNVTQGSFTYSLRERALAWGGATSSPFGEGYTLSHLSGGLGGPLVRNRLFAFGAVQGRWRADALPSLVTADSATLERLGVSPELAARFLALAGTTGVPISMPDLDGDRTTDNTTALVRIDWHVSDPHTLVLRLNGRWRSQEPTRVLSLAFPSTGGTRSERSGGAMASWTWRIGEQVINELRGYVSAARSNASGFLALPEARVKVKSDLPDGTRGIATLAFGANPGFPERSENTSVELRDDVSWLAPDAGHRIKLGVSMNAVRLRADQTPNQLGTFRFASLDELAAGQPESFTRTLAPLEQAGTAWNGTLYLGDTWRVGDGLQVTYGARLEGGRFSGAPGYNPTLDSLFGVRTDRIPSEVHVSPRAGFTWTLGARSGEVPATILRGGAGDFRSVSPTALYAAALGAPGLANAETQLVCIGSAVPTPDWTSYMQDPATIPSQCVDTATALTVGPHPNATVFDPGYGAPRAWRASLGLQQRLFGAYTASVDASYARGVSQYGFRDLNLVSAPRFTLPDEANRPVYVPADSIVPTSGALSVLNSRVNPQFGQVLAISSDLRSDTRQLTIAINRATRRGATLQLSYTLTRARDQSSFSCCAASQGFAAPTTAGDPNAREWATSSLERRHSLLAIASYPMSAALGVTLIGRLTSGVPFTPLVGSDLNGDGARNDRAFVFDPATASDTAVGSAMRSLLVRAPPAVQSCLQSQLGRVAGRNSCAGPWQPEFDVQLNWRPRYFGLERRLTLSILTVNLLGGLDQWLHGPANLQGWGFAAAPDPILLYVRDFDPGARQFHYVVNGRFGATAGANGGVTVPFQIAVQARMAIGPVAPSRRVRALLGEPAASGGGGGGGGGADKGGGAMPADFAARVAVILPSPISPILGLRDSLRLSADQVRRLRRIADSLDAETRSVTDSLQGQVQRAGEHPDGNRLYAQLRPILAEGRAHIRDALQHARDALTPHQWASLPDTLRALVGERPGLSHPDVAARVAHIPPNPISAILGSRDSLRLSADQVVRLQRIADSLEGETRPVMDSVQAQVRQAGEHPDPGLPDVQRLPTVPGDRARIRAALERARDTLTPYQWASLPDTLRALVR